MSGRFRLLIEAESLANDGASAVLFTLVLAWASQAPVDAGPIAAGTTFLVVAGGGLIVGLLVGFAAVLVAGTSDDYLVETALTAVAAFGAFLIAERLHASGVLATVAAGMVMGNVGVLGQKSGIGPALSADGRAFVLQFWEFAAFLANSLVFLLIGSALATDRLRPRGLAGAGACRSPGARRPGRGRLSRLPHLLPFALGGTPSRATYAVVGRPQGRACARARLVAAPKLAQARGDPYARLRGRRLLDPRSEPDGAVRDADARTSGREQAPSRRRSGSAPNAQFSSSAIAGKGRTPTPSSIRARASSRLA